VVEDISERKRTTDALRTIVAATASVTDEDFFRSFVSHLSPAMGVRYAFVGELVEGKTDLVRTLAVWAGNEYGENVSYEIQGTPCERVLTQGVPCFYPQGVQQQFPTDAFLSVIRAESYYGLPLLDRGGHVLGLLAVMHDQPFSLLPGMEEMLIVFAARAGVELERKRTLGELRFSDQALRQLIDEREQLAQDLHDGIIQAIYAAGLGLEEARRLVHENSPAACRQIQTVVSDLNSLIEEVRNHIVRKPREIKTGQQLKLALERLVRVLHTCPTMRIVTVIDRAAADQLLPAEATHVYYIAAEALSNAVRHAQAHECLLALRLVKGTVRLEVSDNGCGFDPSLSTHEGHGLRNLSGRAAKLGTVLNLESSAGGGTRLFIDLPKEPRDAQTETRPYPTADCR
jgi:signal transduction histidine kinase